MNDTLANAFYGNRIMIKTNVHDNFLLPFNRIFSCLRIQPVIIQLVNIQRVSIQRVRIQPVSIQFVGIQCVIQCEYSARENSARGH